MVNHYDFLTHTFTWNGFECKVYKVVDRLDRIYEDDKILRFFVICQTDLGKISASKYPMGIPEELLLKEGYSALEELAISRIKRVYEQARRERKAREGKDKG